MQEHEGALNFATDAWTSLNHKAYVAVIVHFKIKGELVSMLLDLIELAHLHLGLNLAVTFAKILKDFGINDKVSKVSCEQHTTDLPKIPRFSQSPATMHPQMTR
jgi:hypothetical protein